MKKQLLMGISCLIFISASAQTNRVNFQQICKKPVLQTNESVVTGTPIKNLTTSNHKKGNSSISSVTITDIGSSANALTSIGGPKSNTDYNPDINTITFIHRSVTAAPPAADPTTGFYRYDVSKDGGASWTTQVGPIYSDTTGSGNILRGRYPTGLIINPSGNTIADNAFLHFFGTITTTTSDWIGHVYGTGQLGGPMGMVQHVDLFATPYIGTVTGSLETTQNNVVWNVDGSQSATSLTSAEYTGTQFVFNGTWNSATNDIDYVRTDLAAPSSIKGNGFQFYIGSQINFSADGMTGYVTVISNPEDLAATDSADLITVFKTTNGGASWGPGQTIKLDALDSIFNFGPGVLYETAFDLDGIVDASGNLHIVTEIFPTDNTGQAESINVPASGQWGVFDIFTTDQGTTWRAQLLDLPMNFRGTYGPSSATPIAVDNRPQISKTWAGDKLFFTWGDTDTNFFTDGNLHPNINCVGYDINSHMWTPITNLTVGSAAEYEIHIFNASRYVMGTSGTYTIPMTFTQFTDNSNPDPGVQVLHRYIGGATIDDSQFTVADNSILLDIYTVGINENSLSTNGLSIYPNPGKGVTSMEFALKSISKIEVEITNTLGQSVYNHSFGSMSSGPQKISFNTEKLNAGIYFCSLVVNGEKITKKLIVE